uniref:OB domain-containing protein n=1 Tax=Lactuca sativa TaxID=4236 RepID=A0A9R1WBH6_LACSA|nr:hypothetical protein LSAT_V11C200082740 [Lactuca sativa]
MNLDTYPTSSTSQQVKLVRMILNKAERVTDLYFLLDDGTGRIDCNRWVHEPVDTKEMEAITEGMYVRVHGQLFQGKKQNNKLVVVISSNQSHVPSSGINTQSYQTAPSNQSKGIMITCRRNCYAIGPSFRQDSVILFKYVTPRFSGMDLNKRFFGFKSYSTSWLPYSSSSSGVGPRV